MENVCIFLSLSLDCHKRETWFAMQTFLG
uniref:Uncharacterized protein n=1 Tax=Tetranychus urticae TaxID=32264 RepID=T1K8K6_TETUR